MSLPPSRGCSVLRSPRRAVQGSLIRFLLFPSVGRLALLGPPTIDHVFHGLGTRRGPLPGAALRVAPCTRALDHLGLGADCGVEAREECLVVAQAEACHAGTRGRGKIPRIVVGENVTFQGPEEYIRSQGVKVEVLQDPACIQLMKDFIAARPELWNEDIGV